MNTFSLTERRRGHRCSSNPGGALGKEAGTGSAPVRLLKHGTRLLLHGGATRGAGRTGAKKEPVVSRLLKRGPKARHPSPSSRLWVGTSQRFSSRSGYSL